MKRNPQPQTQAPCDGLVNFRGFLVSPDKALQWAKSLMGDFDNLPVKIREIINYSDTLGARPTADIICAARIAAGLEQPEASE